MANLALKNKYESYYAMPTVRAFLDTIAWAEGGINYNTMFGGGSFSGNQHPNYKVSAGGYNSDAAGRYQFLYSTWIGIKELLGLADFSAHNQDLAAIRLIDERGELEKIAKGDLVGTLKGLGCAWASLPYSGCRQKEKSISEVTNYFNNALRVYAGNNINNTVSVIPVQTIKDVASNMPSNPNHNNLISTQTKQGLTKNEVYAIGAASFFLLFILTRG